MTRPPPLQRPCILIDTREQRPLRFSDAVDTERVTLSVADYSIAGLTDTVAIERKSTQDLVHSITQDRERFMDCCRRMKAFEFRLLVVEADINDVLAKLYRGQTNPQSVIGSTIAIFTDYGLPTLWAGNPKRAADMVERILVRMWKKRIAEAA